jgi:hypothetical protein
MPESDHISFEVRQAVWRERVQAALDAAGTSVAPDIVEELAQHARTAFDDAVRAGAAPADAQRRVDDLLARWQRDAAQLRRLRRPAPPPAPPPTRVASWWSGLAHDFRYAARLLRRQPRHAGLVIVTMAIGIAATSTLFSVTYGVLAQPLPWPTADRLIEVRETRGGRPPRFQSFSNAAYHAWAPEAETIDHLAAWTTQSRTLADAGESERITTGAVSTNFFAMLDVAPLRGVVFGPTMNPDERVVVLSERLWRSRFGARDDAVGRSVQLDGVTYAVIGVLPDRFAFPSRQTLAWVPYRIGPTGNNALSLFGAVARLKPGFTPEQAAAEGTTRGQFAANTGMTTTAVFGGDGAIDISARLLKDAMTSGVRQPLVLVFGACLLLFVAAAANIAGLQLARGVARGRELAVRVSLGASFGRTARQLAA